MINLNLLDQYRLRNPAPGMMPHVGDGDDTCGAFEIPSNCSSVWLRCIASSDHGWDHVSVSTEHRIPYWMEMEQIKRLFFSPEDCVMQLHPPLADYVDGTQVNSNPRVLHLWRPHSRAIPRPYKWMVGGMTHEEADKAMKADGF
jgi:hypothetical protein